MDVSVRGRSVHEDVRRHPAAEAGNRNSARAGETVTVQRGAPPLTPCACYSATLSAELQSVMFPQIKLDCS